MGKTVFSGPSFLGEGFEAFSEWLGLYGFLLGVFPQACDALNRFLGPETSFWGRARFITPAASNQVYILLLPTYHVTITKKLLH